MTTRTIGTEGETGAAGDGTTLVLTPGHYLSLDCDGRLHCRLTPCEATCLKTIAGRKGGIATTEELLQSLYGNRGVDDYPGTNNVSVHIYRLRKKIASIAGHDKAPILSARRGYQMALGWSLRLLGGKFVWLSVHLDGELADAILDLACASDVTPNDLLCEFITAGVAEVKERMWS